MCVCLFVCWCAFYRPHDICPLCGAASEWPREQEPSSRAAPRERASACTARARARMPYNFSTKKSYADAFQKQNRTRAHAVVYVTAEIFKKGKKKTNMPLPKFSWSVYFSNRTESYSSQIEFAGPMESRRTRRPAFTAEERLERRREQDRRRHAERRARERREQTQARRDVDRLRSSQARASDTLLQRLQS